MFLYPLRWQFAIIVNYMFDQQQLQYIYGKIPVIEIMLQLNTMDHLKLYIL